MSRRSRHVERFANAIADDRRPPAFRTSLDDIDVLSAAIELGAARRGANLPNLEFVARLADRIGAGPEASALRSSAPVSRRGLLSAAGIATAAAAGAFGERIVTSRSDTTPQSLLPDTPSWIPVASVDDVQAGRVVQFSAGGVTGFLSNHDGRYRAVSASCTHQGCTLRLDAGNQQLQCPCHRAAFNLDGDVVSYDLPMSLRPLPRVATRVRAGNVEVQVGTSAPDPRAG